MMLVSVLENMLFLIYARFQNVRDTHLKIKWLGLPTKLKLLIF